MKRVLNIFCAIAIVFAFSFTGVFAEDFKVIETSPKGSEKDVPIENLGVKIIFNKEVYGENQEKVNKDAFKLLDKDGKEVKANLYFNENDKSIALILMDTKGEDGKVLKAEEKSDYTVVLSQDFTAKDGSKLGKEEKITFTTTDPSKSTWTSMLMMAVVMVVMVGASVRSMKKEKESEKNKKNEKVNPYKQAKKTGKSVEEIVASDKQRKEKEQREREELEAAFEEEIDDEVEERKVYRVKKKRKDR